MWALGLLASVLVVAAHSGATEIDKGTIRLFDFRDGGTHGWFGNHRVQDLRGSQEGLTFQCVGHDPWIESQVVESLPVGVRTRLTLCMRSDGDSSGEVFYGPSFSAENSAQFRVVPDGAWHEYTMMLTPMPGNSRLRIDPAANEGRITIAWIDMMPLIPLLDVTFEAPNYPRISATAPSIQEGPVRIRHGERWDSFAIDVDGEEMAVSAPQSWIGYVADRESRQLDLSDDVCEISENDGMTVTRTIQDPDGAKWTLTRRFLVRPGRKAIDIMTTLVIDRDRDIYHLPWVTLFPGLETYGERKTQAILPGVEYLNNEPSSSEADFKGEQAIRRIVDDYKLCIPMMALQHLDRYVGIVWTRADHPAPVFDSPDRIFKSEAHLMGLWYPGVGKERLENELQVYDTFRIPAREQQTFQYTIIAGAGNSIVPAVQHYLTLVQGLPDLPKYEGDFQDAVDLLAAGWLDSDAHEDGHWRHAIWPGFGPQPASDAAAYMLWLASKTDRASLAGRLRQASARGLERISPDDPYMSRVSHVARPVMPLLLGRVEEHMEGSLRSGRDNLARFDEEGIQRYVRQPNKPDYSETHYADHANGLSACSLENILQAAVFTGDEELIREGLALLDRQTELYANTVPRGAQTWEMPLHTPDILASGRLVRCYVLAYQLTLDPKYLEEARYWAWTGVPLVYLDPPTAGPVGLYATIAVLGATNWVAPHWIGLPVQWCGLVYRSAVQDLAAVDPEDGPFWTKLAHGITLSGLQQTFPLEDKSRQGTLPDFFYLKEQVSDGPAIIPGTVQANLAEVYGQTPLYQMRRADGSAILIHAPGRIESCVHRGNDLIVSVEGWPEEPYRIHLVRLPGKPEQVAWNGTEPLETAYYVERKALTVLVSGSGELVVTQVR